MLWISIIMLDYTVHSVGRFVNSQKGSQHLQHAVISFHIAGQKHMNVANVVLTAPGPYLALLPSGATVSFDYSKNRDQWAIVLDFPALSTGSQPGTVEIVAESMGGRVALPMFTPIVKEHISGWEGEFLRMAEAFQAPCPANRMRVFVGVGNIIRYVIDQRPDTYPSAAAKLRWLIDDGLQMNKTLEELSGQCGYSASRLRVLFEQEYGISPQTYRNKRRMQLARELLSNSDLRIKEISDRIGCRHVSHFCALFKSAFGMTPSMYQTEFRQMWQPGRDDGE
jgi:AraC-like DNA-binding protein